MGDDLLGEFKAKSVLNEVKDRLAPGGIPAHVDVGLEVRNDVSATVGSLLVDGLEEHVHGGLEALLNTGLGLLDAA